MARCGGLIGDLFASVDVDSARKSTSTGFDSFGLFNSKCTTASTAA